MQSNVVTRTELADLKLLSRGKVRDIYEVDGGILLVATDRISAFDCVLPNGIPNKGRVLTALSEFWFERMKDIVPNHIITTDVDEYPPPTGPYRDVLRGRSMLVERAKPYPVECVVRGYLAGSATKEYRQSGSVCGIELPEGLRESEKLPKAIFTPATKAETGHDINISEREMADIIGSEKAALLIEKGANVKARSTQGQAPLHRALAGGHVEVVELLVQKTTHQHNFISQLIFGPIRVDDAAAGSL